MGTKSTKQRIEDFVEYQENYFGVGIERQDPKIEALKALAMADLAEAVRDLAKAHAGQLFT